MKALLRVAVLACLLSAGFSVRIVCYFSNWSLYGSEPFKVEDVDATHCTHVVYAFLGLDANGSVKSVDPWNDIGDEWHEGALKRFPKIKKANPSTKILLGVGGWNEGHWKFQQMVRSPEKRKVFIESTLGFLRLYKFDGLEMDWFYHDGVGGTKEDRDGLSLLVKEMRAFYSEGGYLLGLSTSANPTLFDNSYDVVALNKHLDFINVLAYDLHGSWDGKTGHVAPLHPASGESGNECNVEAVVERILKKGAAASKVNLAVVGYGRTFTLADPTRHGMNSPTTGAGKVDPLPYRAFCVQDRQGLWTKYRDEELSVPYAVSGNQWVGYEDVKSLVEKVKFAKSRRLGGVTFWSLDMDDFKGNCASGKYPLLRAVEEEAKRS